MATPQFYSGYLGTAAISTNELSITQWRVGGTGEMVRFKNSRTGPIPIYAGTFQEYPISMTIDVDFANGIFSTPYSIAVNTVISALNLYQHQSAKSALGVISSPTTTTIPGWVFPSYFVQNIDNTLAVDGKVLYMVSGWGFGAFTTPN
jgi:hypothetical protein